MTRWISQLAITSVALTCAALSAEEREQKSEIDRRSAVDLPAGDVVRPQLRDIGELLTAKISVDFESAPWSKETAVIVAKVNSAYKVKFPFVIKIVQRDLQQGGITKNALIRRFKAKDASVSDVLTKWVMFHNPISTVCRPSEVDQKLVWVLAPDKESILITTRHAAKQKAFDLPMHFRLK